MTPQNSGAGARRSLPKIGRPTLSLHIEELVLHGFASIDGDSASAEKIKQIVDRSGGRWDNLNQSDRQALIDKLGHGNERTARMSFDMRVSSNRAMTGAKPMPGS